MRENQRITSIEKGDLLERVRSLFDGGYRLVQVCCTRLDALQVDYSFDRDFEFAGLRLAVPLDDARLPSISGIYWAAFTYENEIHDLFGIVFEGLNVDYGGKFYRIAKKTPFNAAGADPPVKEERGA
jgi:ech hydrogenase subunit D